jgi:outer membrane protein TolC
MQQMVRAIVVTLLATAVPIVAASQPGTIQANPFHGSVPTGAATAVSLVLSLDDAVDRGLATNLGVIDSAEGMRGARAQWLRSLSRLLPNATARVSRTTEQVSLASLGFSEVPGLLLPPVLGPFSFVDARVFVSQPLFNWSDMTSLRAASASREASSYSYQAARELVVRAAATAYLVAIADGALVDTAGAQVTTAAAVLQQTRDQHTAGVVAAIDVLRARVELQAEQQRLIAAENQLAIDQLNLARLIGLPTGQAFTLSDAVPYSEILSATRCRIARSVN